MHEFMAQPLKDSIDRALVTDIAGRFAAADHTFDAVGFVDAVVPALASLELKARIEAVARGLWDQLGPNYPAALATVVAVAQQQPPISGFAAWPLCTFVELYGVDHPAASLQAMEHLTIRASCEFAVRPFLRHHLDSTIQTLVRLAGHQDARVRRLASEGTRPRLPWGMSVNALKKNPAIGLRILELLKHDPSETVRRSVANHLNDISRDHPGLVVSVCRRWAAEEPVVAPELIRHALRTLVKKGTSEALETLGFTTRAEVEVEAFSVAPTEVVMGDRLNLTATIRSTSPQIQRLVVDLVIHHVTADGRTSPKVFKWATVDVAPDERLTLKKTRLIRHASTRTYHAGQHAVDLQVAGTVRAQATFVIVST